MEYIFNYFYRLRHDKYRTFILSPQKNDAIVDVDADWVSIIHPIYAMIFSFFSKPIVLDVAIKRISSFFSLSENTVKTLLQKIIESDIPFHIEYKGYTNNFPKNIIIPAEKMNSPIVDYAPSMFKYAKVDMETIRLYEAPLNLTFMVNNVCLTHCVYCYANKDYKCKLLDFSTVKKIIKEAYEIGIHNFSVDGGEFFIYPYWRELLEELRKYKFTPSIVSTKYPINEIDIKDFAAYNLPLQISIDSFDPDILDHMVGRIPNYTERMLHTLITVDRLYTFQIATILTRFNGNIPNLEQMFEKIKLYKNIRKWEIRIAFKSLYTRNDFLKIQLERSRLEEIEKWVQEKQKEVSFNILYSPSRDVNFFKSEEGSGSFIGARCSANSTHMFILPDGKVTICEQLYWNKNFLIGDLKEQSIAEVWNSPQALRLAHFSTEDYSEDSKCKECALLEQCGSYMNKCYTNIIKVYGEEHWDYPDPRCIFAPQDISDSIYV